jgi:hypothetical protein
MELKTKQTTADVIGFINSFAEGNKNPGTVLSY